MDAIKLLTHTCAVCKVEVLRTIWCWNHKQEECRECLTKQHLSKLPTYYNEEPHVQLRDQ